MIKNRLKELEIKITELASYLSISRPTTYKFIEMYDSGEKKDLSSSICGLFDYIEEHELIDKKNVVNYILNNVAIVGDVETDSNADLIRMLGGCIHAFGNEKKQMIEYIIQNDDLDPLIEYLITANKISKKKKIAKKDSAIIESLEKIKKIITEDN